MAKVIKGEMQYALIIDQDEIDLLRAITQRVGGNHFAGSESPDWRIYNAVAPYSEKDFTDFFEDTAGISWKGK